MGFHLSPKHFYFPIPDTKTLQNYDFSKLFPLDGITIETEEMLSLLRRFKLYRDEYAKIYTNSPYESNGDGSILYSMVREYKPKKIIEIGSGFSTRVSSIALEMNGAGKILVIEPYPKQNLHNIVSKHSNVSLLTQKVEDVDFSFFQQLQSRDFCFIDSSHVVKTGNDVHFIYLHLLPQIPTGVIIHIHDIRFPEDYPKDWLLKYKHFWNEQYLLQMFLAFNESFKILFAGNYMRIKYPDLMQENLVGYDANTNGWPGCFWIQRIR